jgi:hypothetical protein
MEGGKKEGVRGRKKVRTERRKEGGGMEGRK